MIWPISFVSTSLTFSVMSISLTRDWSVCTQSSIPKKYKSTWFSHLQAAAIIFINCSWIDLFQSEVENMSHIKNQFTCFYKSVNSALVEDKAIPQAIIDNWDSTGIGIVDLRKLVFGQGCQNVGPSDIVAFKYLKTFWLPHNVMMKDYYCIGLMLWQEKRCQQDMLSLQK